MEAIGFMFDDFDFVINAFESAGTNWVIGMVEESFGNGQWFIVGVCEDLHKRGLDTVVPLAKKVTAWKI